MCSRKGAAVRGGGRDHPVSLVGRLHELLDALLGSDLDDLTADDQGRLVCRLVEAQQRLHAATAQAVGAFDGADVAIASRHRTTVRWLEHRTRLSAGAAAHLTRTARALRDHLPATHEALAGGRITSQHVAAVVSVVRTVGPEHASAAEPVLLDLARRSDPATVRRATAALFAAVDPAGAEKALHTAYEKRGLQVSVAGEHGYLDGVLDLESTELLQSALMPLMAPAGPADTRSAAQRRADALLDIVTKHLGTEEMPVVGGHRPHLSVVVDADQLPPDTPAPGDTGFGEGGFGGDRSPGSVRSRRGLGGDRDASLDRGRPACDGCPSLGLPRGRDARRLPSSAEAAAARHGRGEAGGRDRPGVAAPRCRTHPAHGDRGTAQGARRPGRGVRPSGLQPSTRVLRRPPRAALGRRRRDGADQPRAALPAPPPHPACGVLADQTRPRHARVVLDQRPRRPPPGADGARPLTTAATRRVMQAHLTPR